MTKAPTQITLRCPQCERAMSAPADPTDPPRTATVVAVCDRCDDGGKSEVLYFDVDARPGLSL